MIRHHLILFFRNLIRNKLYSFIHIAGLAVAFLVCTLLFLTSYFYLSYDSFHNEKSQLFRTSRFINHVQGPEMSSQQPLPAKSALETTIPDIETAVRINMAMPENISYGDKNIEKVVLRTDSNFFEVFNFPIKEGSSHMALSGVQDIAISASTAKALFGDANAIGREVKIGRKGEERFFTVSTLLNDCPKNSSIRFDAVARIESLPNYAIAKNDWSSNTCNVFVKISKHSDQETVEDKLVAFVEKYYPEQLAQLKTEHPEKTRTRELLSVNLTNIENIQFSGVRSTSKALVYAIMGLGIFILLIACFNFVNLNLAYSFQRSRELGVRKTLGAFKGQLFLQLWGEAFVLYLLAFIIGVSLAHWLLPAYSAQFDVPIQISMLFQPAFLGVMLAVFFFVTLIAAGYPAIKIADFKLVDILRGNVSIKKPGTLRDTLLVSQFTISTLLICVSLIAGQQLNHLREKPVGFAREQVISIPMGAQVHGRKVLSRMRNELSNDPNIISVTGAGSNLGRGRDRITSRTTVGFDYGQNQISADWLLADFDFLKTLGIPILKGRDFNRNFVTDTVNTVVVTESFVKAMGESDPIGKYFGGEDDAMGNQIIGVVSDFNAYSPSGKTLPIAIHLSPTEPIKYMFLKVRSDDPQAMMQHLSAVWDKVTDSAVFNASFLNENLQAWYEGEQVITTIFAIASGIAVFLSCLGLFAISLLVIEQRTKEIGIRKVLGASVASVVALLSRDFIRLVVIAIIIATPIAWYAMNRWLESFAYRIELQWWMFAVAGLTAITVAILTVAGQSVRAALADPVEAIQNE